MNIKDLVVTGIVKFLKSVNIDTIVVEKLNEVTKNELDTLHGVTSNIQDQFSSVSSSLETAELEQTNWKTRVASAINAIPKKNPTGLTKTSALVKFESELKNTQDAIEGATAVAANVLSPKKYVGSNGYLTDGTMPDRTNQASQWVGYEGIIVQKHPQDPDNQVLITITNTKNNYYGFYDNTSTIYANMYLPADKIAYGVRVGRCPSSIGSFGADDTNTVLGTFTGDANATASDILSGKSAYVRGLKISGNIPDNTGVPKAIQWCRDYNGRFEVAVDLGYYGCSWHEDSYEYLEYSQVASAIGLTAGKIIKGNTILGITGTGQTGVDTGDANATASDILSGKSAYVKGQKISGSIVAKDREPETDTLSYWYPEGGVPYLCLYPNNEPDERYYRIQRGIRTRASNLGDATMADVISGKRFTSSNGLNVTGTMPEYTDVSWVEETNGILMGYYSNNVSISVPLGAYVGRHHFSNNSPIQSYVNVPYSNMAQSIGLTAGKIVKGNTILGIAGTGQTGVDTSDANATTADIRKSKTAYVNGSKVTGTMPELKDYYKPFNETIGMINRTSYVDSSGASHSVPSTKYLYIRMDSTGYVTSSSNDVLIPASKLGDATASDVLKGKTFTSINGVKIVGTMEGSGSTTLGACIGQSNFTWGYNTTTMVDHTAFYSYTSVMITVETNANHIIIDLSSCNFKLIDTGTEGGIIVTRGRYDFKNTELIVHKASATSAGPFRASVISNKLTVKCIWSGTTVQIIFLPNNSTSFVSNGYSSASIFTKRYS